MKEQAREAGEPVTRKALKDLAKKKRKVEQAVRREAKQAEAMANPGSRSLRREAMTDELRALADRWARELIDQRGLDLLDIERFGAVLVDRARNRIQSGTVEGAGDAGSKRKGRVRR